MSASNPDATVVLPTYNEAATINTAISRVRQVTTRTVEVIVVDDDSPDGTGELVNETWDTPLVTAIVRTHESGLSSAVLRGFDAASTDTVAVMDADLQHPPSSLPLLFDAVDDGADVAVGSRHVESGRVAADWPLHRRIISWGASALAWGLVPPSRELSDPMSGFFAVDASLVTPVRACMRPHGYKILLELLARAPLEDIEERGYTFEERKDGASNLGPREYVRYVRLLTRLSLPSRVNQPNSTRAIDGETTDE